MEQQAGAGNPCLVDALRVEVTGLQGEWEERRRESEKLRKQVEALGEELEAKRRRLRLAEATVELMQRRQEEAVMLRVKRTSYCRPRQVWSAS
jgi:phage-related minor tail protein